MTMTNIGHNNPPHQLATVELEGVKVTLYQRGDISNPTWHMRIKVPGSTKYVRTSTKCTDFNEAKEVALERYYEIKLQIKNDFPVFSKTFGDIARAIIAENERKFERGDITKKNRDCFKNTLNRYYIPFFGTKQIVSIKQSVVDDFWDWRIDYWKNNGSTNNNLPSKDHTPKPSTLHIEANMLNIVFNKAISGGFLQSQLKPNHKPPVKNVKTRRGELSRDEYRRLCKYMFKWVISDTDQKTVYVRSLLQYVIKVAVNSGMRPPEIYNLTWEDYSKHSDDGLEWTELKVHGKGKKHTIMCSIRVFNDIENWKQNSNHTKLTDFVFARHDGSRLIGLNRQFKKLLVEAGIPLEYQGEARTLYSLRHTYATFQLRSGVDVYHLAENMDTGIDMIKDHYGHVKGPDRARAMLGRR